jgi:hypothetical protein
MNDAIPRAKNVAVVIQVSSVARVVVVDDVGYSTFCLWHTVSRYFRKP